MGQMAHRNTTHGLTVGIIAESFPPQLPPLGRRNDLCRLASSIASNRGWERWDYSTRSPSRGGRTKCGACPAARPNNIRSAKPTGSEGVASGSGSRINKKLSNPYRAAEWPRTTTEGSDYEEEGAHREDRRGGWGVQERAQKHFEAFEEVVTEALKAGEEVQITGFGKFSVKERRAREGRNPQTGENMKIAAQKVPAFSAGNALKEAV